MKMIALMAVMAIVTYIIRALPITLFRKEIKSKWLKSFLYYIPYAVLGAMTFPAIFFSTGSVFSASLGLVGAMLMAFFDIELMAAAVTSVIIAFVSSFFV